MTALLHTKIIKRCADDGGCWDWQGSLTPAGYGRYWFEGRLWPTHRLIYTLMVGPIPEGLTLDHLCQVKACVNPEHLEPVTQAENGRRATHALVTVCKYGHPMSGDNLRISPSGRRLCRECQRQREAKRNADPEHRAKVNAANRERYARDPAYRATKLSYNGKGNGNETETEHG